MSSNMRHLFRIWRKMGEVLPVDRRTNISLIKRVMRSDS